MRAISARILHLLEESLDFFLLLGGGDGEAEEAEAEEEGEAGLLCFPEPLLSRDRSLRGGFWRSLSPDTGDRGLGGEGKGNGRGG